MQVVTPAKPHSKMPPPRGYGAAKTRRGTLALALAAGLAAALLAFLLLRGRQAGSGPLPVPVVIAARDIPARTRLSAAWLRVRMASPQSLPDGAVSAPGELLGKVTTEPVAAGAAILRQAVAAPTAALGMAFALPSSQRAVTVALDAGDSADQFARPGDHVDVLATDEPGSGPADARTVLQNVRLLAVGTQTAPEAAPAAETSGASHVTLAVSPPQAQALVLAAARGKLHLSLRAADDEAIAPLAPAPAPRLVHAALPPAPRRAHLQTPSKPAPAPGQARPLLPLPVAPPAHVTMTIIKGSQSQTVSVEP